MGNVVKHPGLAHPGLVRRKHPVHGKRRSDSSDPFKAHKTVHHQEARATELLAAGWGINTG